MEEDDETDFVMLYIGLQDAKRAIRAFSEAESRVPEEDKLSVNSFVRQLTAGIKGYEES